MAEELTLQQRDAVYDRGGRLLVSAAAGSGKTKVLVDRLMSYVLDPENPANLDDFLIITFTKAAASELRTKISNKLSELMAQFPENRHLHRQMQRLYLAKISTVHSFCADVLREYAYQVDLPADFRVADENECAILRDACLNQCLEEAYTQSEDLDFYAFIDSQGWGRNDDAIVPLLLKVYDNARCSLNPREWFQNCIDRTQTSGVNDMGQTPWGEYLIDNLQRYLSLQIKTYEKLAQAADEGGLSNPATLFRSIAVSLQYLQEARTWDEVVERKKIDFGRLNFPRKNVDEQLIESLRTTHKFCKDMLTERLKVFTEKSEVLFEDIQQTQAATRGLIKLLESFDRAYTAAKRRMRMVDFNDLEHYTLDLLLGKSRSGPTAAAKEISNRFREIMVDEYQDSNATQDAIYMTLTEARQNCFMVGDVKQSIYQFRQADPGIFLKKYNEYLPVKQAVSPQSRKVTLSSNFRSGGGVLAGANDVFSYCMSTDVGGLIYGKEEALEEGTPHESIGEPEVELWAIETENGAYVDEAAFVAQRIRELTDGTHLVRSKTGLRPIELGDIAILLRTKSNVAVHYKKALEQRGIPCTSEGGEDILQTQEGQLLHAILQVISNPRQDIPLLAVLASPIFCVSADELAQIRSENRYGCIYDAIQSSSNPKILEFLRCLSVWRRDARLQPLAKLVESIFAMTRMDSIFAAMPNGFERQENLQTFYEQAVSYEKIGRRDLEQFLQHLQGFGKKGMVPLKEQSGGNSVTIMTIHKSKGLEYPVVFVSDLAHTFSSQSTTGAFLCDKDLGLGMTTIDHKNRVRYPSFAKNAVAAKIDVDGLSESIRVLYVALTRARDRLIMTYGAKKLKESISELAARMSLVEREQLIQDVSCLGDWVMMAALQRTEAGEFLALCDTTPQTHVGEHPWKIGLVRQAEYGNSQMEASVTPEIPKEYIEKMQAGLSFVYGHQAATLVASKQTATQRKGRQKDAEAQEDAVSNEAFRPTWRKPTFSKQKQDGAAAGTATHAVMQYIRYDCCTDEQGVQKEVQRLIQEHFLTVEQGEMVDCRKIAAFFNTELGKRLQKHKDVLREFKFTVLENAEAYDDALAGEEILLQGVVDCAMVDEDGIVVIDFKTDYVTQGNLADKVTHYRPQILAYAQAMSQIYQRPVKEAWLYFFGNNQAVAVQ
ncbi:MAG: helicase-exonuclease AddAB subunit AddA [Ruminococcaceae bacterium]|nr:helicase-exonuclease AddAB subunit AddA [Oscillospiraceae bacterium]